MAWFRIFQQAINRDQFVDTGIQMESFYTNAIVIPEYTNYDIQQWGALWYEDAGVEVPLTRTFAYSQLLYARSTLWRPDRVGLGNGTLWIYVSRGCPLEAPIVEVWSP